MEVCLAAIKAANIRLKDEAAVAVEKDFGSSDGSMNEFYTLAVEALESAAALRCSREIVSTVEHFLQQRLFEWHEEVVANFATIGDDIENALHNSVVFDCLDEGSLASPNDGACAWSVVGQVLDAIEAVLLQKALLAKLRAVEHFFTVESKRAKKLSPQFNLALKRLEEALLDAARDELREGGETAEIDKKILFDYVSKKYEAPRAINRLSIRPYDPDAPFAPHLMLTVSEGVRSLKPSDVGIDICGVCSNVIAGYAKPKARSHCLDCDNGWNAMCGACHKISFAVYGFLHAVDTYAASRGPTPPVVRLVTKLLLGACVTMSPHVEHHNSGLVEHCMEFIYRHVSARYASMRAVIQNTFAYHKQRPMFGLIEEVKSNDLSARGEGQGVTLSRAMPSTYRCWQREVMHSTEALDNHLFNPDSVDDDTDPRTILQLTPQQSVAQEASPRWRSHCNVFLPVKQPVEPSRIPSEDIGTSAELYLNVGKAPPLVTKWLSYGQLEPLVYGVAAIAKAFCGADGDFVCLSCHDSALWYAIEIGIVMSRRCAVGIYPLWEPRDILDAMDLSKARLAILDVDVFVALTQFIQQQRERNDGNENEGKGSSHLLLLCPHILVLANPNDESEGENSRVAVAKRMWAALSRSQGDSVKSPHRGAVAEVSFHSADMFVDSTSFLELAAPLHLSLSALPLKSPSDADDNVRRQRAKAVDPPLEEWEKEFLREKPKKIEAPDDRIAAVAVFTSGTSGGKPKGVTTHARMWQLETSGGTFLGISDNSISAYAPSWATDKHYVWRSVLRGGRCSFHCKSQSIFDSIREARPSPSLSIVPFLANQLQPMMDTICSLERQRRQEAATALLRGLSALPLDVTRSIDAISAAVGGYYVVEHMLGGKAYVLSLGGAAVRPDVIDFLRRVTPCVVMENYGLTECGGVLRDNKPFPGSEVKLIDRPDLGYTTADKPYPRGEFAVKNTDISKPSEWICDEGTREAISKRYLPDGYFLTGDIGLQRSDGTYEVIDRASAVRKLANGKFFSPERVEQTVLDYIGALGGGDDGGHVATGDAILRAVVNCFVLADDEDNATIEALFLLNRNVIQPLLPVGPSEVFLQTVVADCLLQAARDACASRGVPKDETPSVCLVEDITFDWTPQNNCLTASRKPNRRALLERWRLAKERLVPGALARPAQSNALTEDPSQVDRLAHALHGTITSQDDTAAFLLREIVPSAPQTIQPEALHSLFPSLGCDSLVLSRVPKLIGPLLLRLRSALSAEWDGATIRDAQSISPLTWSAPSLMRHSPMSLAAVVWNPTLRRQASAAAMVSTCADANTEGCMDDVQAESQPHIARQTSVSMEPQSNSADGMGSAQHSLQDIIASSSEGILKDPTEPATTQQQEGGGQDSADGSKKEGDTLVDRIRRIEDECSERIKELCSDIQLGVAPRAPLAQCPTNDGENEKKGKWVVVTGAVGFLGSAVVHTLLHSEWVEKVVCIARSDATKQRAVVAGTAANAAEGVLQGGTKGASQRVWDAIARVCLPTTISESQRTSERLLFDEKCRVYDGDLQYEHFGMDPEGYAACFHVRPFDLIIHAAAVVKSWSTESGLEALRAPNVDATLHVIQLSVEGGALRHDATPIPILYVSTISVCKSQIVTSQDDGLTWTRLSDLPPVVQEYFDSYSATKLIAENMVREWAHLTNSPLAIIRPPLLTWHTITGAENSDDWLCRVIDAVVATRIAPTSSIFTEKTNFCPVDVAADIVRSKAAQLSQLEKVTAENAFRVVYLSPSVSTASSNQAAAPNHTPSDGRLSICIQGVLRLVDQVVTRTLRDEAAMNIDELSGVQKLRRAMGSVRWVPAFAWRAGMEAIAASAPTSYHPLLSKGILELQRAAGVRAVHPTGDDEALMNAEDRQEAENGNDEEKYWENQLWRAPLTKNLTERLKVKP